jgi:hypothetical protein
MKWGETGGKKKDKTKIG